MSTIIEIKLVVPLYCAPCRRTSYRWYFQVDMEEDATHHLMCLGCKKELFLIIIKNQNIQVYDSAKQAVGYVTR